MTSAEIIALADRYLFPTYARAPLALVRGEGTRVWDADGREYLDFFSSTVVTNLGHQHPAVVRAIEQQAHQILHVSNLHYCEPQARLAERLVRRSFADRVFLCNSGAEANEAAIKLARKVGHARGDGRYEIITLLNSFHGRTLATIAATGQEKVRVGFEPVQQGFRYAAYDDPAALEAAISPRTIAIMVEPVQGEGGIVAPPPEYFQALRALCDRHGLLLIFDEIQTGMGRCGTFFAYEQLGVTPDIMTLAKGLGAGVPIGAMLAAAPIADILDKGSHGSTFGGNALTCAVALAVCDVLESEGALGNCQAMGERLRAGLAALAGRHPTIRAVRGRGLLLGAELDQPGGPVVARCLARGLIINCTANTVLRITPPLTVSAAEVDAALAILDGALAA
ncbi:aspartate aminotransferase family protein [bacterium]|nr:aspartate aminotransferase family protein [bacterium]